MGAGASASVEGGRTVSDELFGKLDEAKAGVLTLVELDAAGKKLSASDEQVASMAQKKLSMFGDGWDLDADEDDPSKTVDADGFYAIVTRVYPHLAAPAAAAAEPAEDEAATKLQCACARSSQGDRRAQAPAPAAPAPAPITAASIAALPQLPKAREAPAAPARRAASRSRPTRSSPRASGAEREPDGAPQDGEAQADQGRAEEGRAVRPTPPRPPRPPRARARSRTRSRTVAAAPPVVDPAK